MLVVLDTTVLIDCLRGRPATARLEALLQGGDIPSTTALNVEEIYRGLRPSEEGVAERLIGGLVVLSLGESEGRRAGTWRRDLAKRGVTVAQADCLIAAAAFLKDGTLATGNPKDFPMKGLRVQHWPVGR